MSLLPAFAALGFAAGVVHFGSLRWLARRLLAGGASWTKMGVAHAARLVAISALLVACARQGAGALLWTAAGIVAARGAVAAAARGKGDET